MTGKPKKHFLSAPLSSGAAQPNVFDCADCQSIGDKDVSPSSHVTANPLPPYLEALTASLSVVSALLALLTTLHRSGSTRNGGRRSFSGWVLRPDRCTEGTTTSSKLKHCSNKLL